MAGHHPADVNEARRGCFSALCSCFSNQPDPPPRQKHSPAGHHDESVSNPELPTSHAAAHAGIRIEAPPALPELEKSSPQPRLEEPTRAEHPKSPRAAEQELVAVAPVPPDRTGSAEPEVHDQRAITSSGAMTLPIYTDVDVSLEDVGVSLQDVEMTRAPDPDFNNRVEQWTGASAGHAEQTSKSTQGAIRPDSAPAKPILKNPDPREIKAASHIALPPLPTGLVKRDSGSEPQIIGRTPGNGSQSALPLSKTPIPTPMGTPRKMDSPREWHDADDGSRVVGSDGGLIESKKVEAMIRNGIEAVSHCMLVSHWTSSDIGCLLTLKSSPGSAGVALDTAGLQLAGKSGSEAATVMSARQCALFRRGLAQALEHVNQKIAGLKIQIKRFQVLRDEFSFSNGLLWPSQDLNRRMILQRYRHIVDDMYQYEARYPHKWMHNLSGIQNENISSNTMDGAGHLNNKNSAGNEKQLVSSGWDSGPLDDSVSGANQDEIEPSNQGQPTLRSRPPIEKPDSVPSRIYMDSPRDVRQPSPRLQDGSPRGWGNQKGNNARLPQSVRMLSMEGAGSAQSTPRDRGRYSPAFSAGGGNPFQKSGTPSSVSPPGPLGIGGANIDGFVNACAPRAAKPPKHTSKSRPPDGGALNGDKARQPAQSQSTLSGGKKPSGKEADPMKAFEGWAGFPLPMLQGRDGDWTL